MFSFNNFIVFLCMLFFLLKSSNPIMATVETSSKMYKIYTCKSEKTRLSANNVIYTVIILYFPYTFFIKLLCKIWFSALIFLI